MSLEEAVSAITSGRVRVGGQPTPKPGTLVAADVPIVVEGDAPQFVSRGGEKLHSALHGFSITVAGRRALDAGASTGGFTDCLLQHGAASVVAVDVGYGQLHERLRTDERVDVHDRTNIRTADPAALGPPFDLIVADLSFISLRTVIPRLAGPMAATEADMVLLVKPQFEATRKEADAGRGVIRSPAVWRRVLGGVADALAESHAAMIDAMVSPLAGADGNVEFLVHARAHSSDPGIPAAPVLDRAVAAASGEPS